MKLNQRGKVNERHKGLLSMRQKAFYTHPSLFQPQGISWYRKFIIQRRRLRTDAPFMWVNTPFRIFSFFYQHQPVIKREFTGKGVLAEVFRISSVQCGNKFRHKFQLLIVTKSSQLCRQTDPMSVGFFLRSVVFNLCQSFCISFVPVWCTPTMASFPSHRSNILWFP